MKTNIERAKEFFEQNPEAQEVHISLGECFADYDSAEHFLRGIYDEKPETITRAQLQVNAEGLPATGEPNHNPVETTIEDTDKAEVAEPIEETITAEEASTDEVQPEAVAENKNERRRKR